MHKLTRGIASASARHPWRTITAWLAVTGAVFFLAIAAGGTFVDDFSSPGSQSATALELLDESFPEAAKGSAMVVLAAHDGTTLDEHQDEIAQVLDDVSDVARVESVADPFAAGTISEDGRIGFAVMTLDAAGARDRQAGVRRPVRGRRPAWRHPASRSSSAATPSSSTPRRSPRPTSRSACSWPSLVLLVVFGTVIAAIVPIGLSLVAVGASIGGIMLMASTMNVSVSAIAVAGLVGLGVGVDYALFVVARYRENRTGGSGQHQRPVQRDGHLGHCRRLRRWDRHHRHGGPGHHRPGHPDLDRPRHRPDGAERRRRRRDPAAGPAHPARRPDRRRPGGAAPPPCRPHRGQRLVALRPPRVPPPLALPPGCSSPCSRPSRRPPCRSRPRSRQPGTHPRTPPTARRTTSSPRDSASGSTPRSRW